MRNRLCHPLRKINKEGRCSSPPWGVLKLNIDGSSRGNLCHASRGGVGRDSSGDIRFIFSIYKGFHTNNLMEALAILYVVERSCALGWKQNICEYDSHVVVTLLNEHQLDKVSWHLAMLIRHILWLCNSTESATFNRIPREWNGVADCLAKWASDHG
ncbi:uncharacterized protein LOC131875972 [Cryptomeria japonica]|uniref:uncharacterized protein LOC131875972 n=1 Tax=Cryptomeria japonica TaxID=3369 RepID=UPI0027DA2B75|nr:uncharacterized protein LOC131875972 [Cryptomeria japonica]